MDDGVGVSGVHQDTSSTDTTSTIADSCVLDDYGKVQEEQTSLSDGPSVHGVPSERQDVNGLATGQPGEKMRVGELWAGFQRPQGLASDLSSANGLEDVVTERQHVGSTLSADESAGGLKSDLSHSTLGSMRRNAQGLEALGLPTIRKVDNDRTMSMMEEEENSASTTKGQNLLGPVRDLWVLVMECLSLYVEAGDDDIMQCLALIRRVCNDEREEEEEGDKSVDDETSESTTGRRNTADTENQFSSLASRPRYPSEAMRAIANILFRQHECNILLNALLEMDSLAEEEEDDDDDDEEEEEEEDDEEVEDKDENIDQEGRNSPRKTKPQLLVESVEILQGCVDPQVRRWAIKGMWMLLHVCGKHPEVDQIMPGLGLFEAGLVPVDRVRIAALISKRPDGIQLANRNMEVRPLILRKAFAQSLLYRMIALEQRNRKAGSKASFTLGSTGSGSSIGGGGNRTTLGSIKFDDARFTFSSQSAKQQQQQQQVRESNLINSTIVEREVTERASVLSRKGNTLQLRKSENDEIGDGMSSSLGLDGGAPNRNTMTNLRRKNTGIGGENSPRASDGIRASGLRHSRLAQLIMAARRSSMSMIGSVHTFKSDDLDFGPVEGYGREGSGLGLDNRFNFPRLTNLSIPEHSIFEHDVPIWSSKSPTDGGAGMTSPSSLNDTNRTIHGFVAGIDYIDCATIMELITGRIVPPSDVNFFQTTNPFIQHITVASKELIPLLLSMLSWISHNLVRKDFLASIYTLTLASQHNFDIMLSIDGWRTSLLRILQSIPRDPDFRDVASDYIIRGIVELVCVTSIPRFPLKNGIRLKQPSNVANMIYELAVLCGWNRDSISFVGTVFSTCMDLIMVEEAARSVTPELVLYLARLVEMFVLYMPCRDDALLGFSNKPRKAKWIIMKHNGNGRLVASSMHSFQTNTTGGGKDSFEDDYLDAKCDENEQEKEQDHEERENGDDHEDEEDGLDFEDSFESSTDEDEDGPNGNLWHWAPLLSQRTPLEMAEHQVVFLEFQAPFQRRGVDFGLHIDSAHTYFQDEALLEKCIEFAEHYLDVFATTRQTDEDVVCLAATRSRLIEVLKHVRDVNQEVMDFERKMEFGIEESVAANILMNSQFALMKKRLAHSSLLSCNCTHCRNTRVADQSVCVALDRLRKRLNLLTSSATRSRIRQGSYDSYGFSGIHSEEDLLENAEHFALDEDGETGFDVTNSEGKNGPHLPKLALDKICPICKHVEFSSSEDLDEDKIVVQVANLSLNQRNQSSNTSNQLLEWKGFQWHSRHLRCYTCAKVLKVGGDATVDDDDDEPVLDEYSEWPFCSECAVAMCRSCPACGEKTEREENVYKIPHHRTYHKEHIFCSICGDDEAIPVKVNDSMLFLCEFHHLEEIRPRCNTCSGLILNDSDGVVIGHSTHVHVDPKCFSCRVCGQHLSVETACQNELEKGILYCKTCVETSVRPTCAVCATIIPFSSSRKIVVPTRANRINVEAFDVVESIVTGHDGRLRCHNDCMRCIACEKMVGEENAFYMIPSNEMNCYKLFCREHGHEMSMYTNILASHPNNMAESDLQENELEADENLQDQLEHEQDSEQKDVSAISPGLFLYVDSSGTQAGPVDGNQLCQLAANGEIHGGTHVWTPGMSEWKALGEL